MVESYRTLLQLGQNEFTIEKSRFIGHAAPVESKEAALAFIETIRKKHWDATHNAWAYMIEANLQRFSDDGEPQGTAGIPILEVLKKEQLIQSVVVVTRYFGGIKLGAGGLIRAYTQGAKIALDSAQIITKALRSICFAQADYSHLKPMQNELQALGIRILDIQYTDKVHLEILFDPQQETSLHETLMEISSGSVIITPGDARFVTIPQ